MACDEGGGGGGERGVKQTKPKQSKSKARDRLGEGLLVNSAYLRVTW